MSPFTGKRSFDPSQGLIPPSQVHSETTFSFNLRFNLRNTGKPFDPGFAQ